jgi:iron complex transport system ATP-binding protein
MRDRSEAELNGRGTHSAIAEGELEVVVRGPEASAGPEGDYALKAEGLSVGYGERLVIEELSLSIGRGEVTAFVGPNGSGKSTLLKTMSRLLAPRHGTVYLDSKAITKMAGSAVARQIAVLPQGPVAPSGITVAELVEQGRFPHAGALRMLRHQDYSAISEALELTGMTEFAQRPMESLSGGERQRAWIALALAQATPTLLLDEPTTFLDIGHQLEVLELVRRLNVEKRMTVVLVLHDLNQAARYASRMVALNNGRIVADGPPAEVLTEQMLAEVFGVRAHIIRDPERGTPVCLPYANVAG